MIAAAAVLVVLAAGAIVFVVSNRTDSTADTAPPTTSRARASTSTADTEPRTTASVASSTSIATTTTSTTTPPASTTTSTSTTVAPTTAPPTLAPTTTSPAPVAPDWWNASYTLACLGDPHTFSLVGGHYEEVTDSSGFYVDLDATTYPLADGSVILLAHCADGGPDPSTGVQIFMLGRPDGTVTSPVNLPLSASVTGFDGTTLAAVAHDEVPGTWTPTTVFELAVVDGQLAVVSEVADSPPAAARPTECVSGPIDFGQDLSGKPKYRRSTLLLQQALRRRGYNPGAADGYFGSDTWNAVLAWMNDTDGFTKGWVWIDEGRITLDGLADLGIAC